MRPSGDIATYGTPVWDMARHAVPSMDTNDCTNYPSTPTTPSFPRCDSAAKLVTTLFLGAALTEVLYSPPSQVFKV
jgi:hypothetical protein